jgi:hypothetical protein
MGSGTDDPHRAKNPVVEAIGKGIEWDELVQLVDVLLANYNAKPHTSLGGVSPLDSLRIAINSRSGYWISRPSAPYTASSPRIGVQVLRRRIGGSVRNRVPPYVEIGEERYTEACLSSRYDLIGKHVYVHLPKDIRTVECYLDSGPYIGDLKCMNKGWSLSPHSFEDRQIVNALVRKGEMWVPDGGDPMVAYLGHLEKKAITKAATDGRPLVSADASAVADLLLRSAATPARSSCAPSSTPANDPTVSIRNRFIGVVLPGKWK